MNMKHTGTSKITAAVVVLLIAALAVMLLTGCTSKSADDAVPTNTPEQEEVTPTPKPTPAPTQTPEITPEPIATPEPTPAPMPQTPVVNQAQTGIIAPDNQEGEVNPDNPLDKGDVNALLDAAGGTPAGECQGSGNAADVIGGSVEELLEKHGMTWDDIGK